MSTPKLGSLFPNSNVGKNNEPAMLNKAHFMPFDFQPIRHAKLGM